MKLKHLTSAAMMASWLLAGSCALDEREVRLALPQFGIGGSPAGSAGAGGLPDAIPRLVVGTTAIDLGWVTTGFAARARIRVDNVGTAPLPAPAVSFAAGSHADFSLIQDGCAQGVAAGESCELRVQFVPSGNGERAATLDVRSDVGGQAQVALNGLGLNAGDLILAPVAGSFEDFGGARMGSTLQESFSISNPTDVASGPLRFRVNRPEFELLAPGQGDCVPDVTSLVGGQSCTLRVAFTPTERGPLEATLTGATDGVGAVSLTLAGRGLAPAALSVSAPTVDFAGVVLLSSARRNVLFENAGDEPLTLAGSRLEPENVEGFSILNSDCGAGAQIAGGASCSVQLEFRPPRVGEELTAELIVEGAEVGQMQAVGLRGIGLEPGALTLSAAAEGGNDFGAVLLGESSERSFQIENPSAQASGVLDIVVSEGFALAAPSEGAPGECIPGSTSLVDGEACTVRVLFTPSRRELLTGSLTISSALAGATELPLAGRGIVPARLAVERELNFGRVLTGSSGVRTLAIGNEGDQPLPPPTFELAGSAPTQVAAFSLVSQCTGPLALGETCEINLTFAPTDATAHAVTLNISSMGTNTSVLLLGEAQIPGSLVLSAAGNEGAFGDVPIGTTTSRALVLANPGQIPSGRVTISSDNNRFAIDLGDCNQGDPAGLVDGASCTFNVRFTPDDNLPQAANLTVQSPGAGRAGMQVSGRGRLPASLASATGNRDLGRANVGQDAIREPQNEFTWTVNNPGDLPTGALTVQNDNPTEFTVRNDSCSGSAVAGRASCEMIIRFRPSTAGNRSARVVVTDPSAARSATLALTGLGVQLAALGQSCVNAECSAGTCTRGVCCDRACDRTCQVCSTQGQCIDQSSQEACGNSAACFGVDNCKLPAGRACSQNGGDAQCGSGQCERRLGGTGAGDRICCLDDCGNALQCNAQNRCQAPTLGAGEACGAAGQLACGAGLECKACLDGARRCTAPNVCCGGCGAGYQCNNGTCGCAPAAGGGLAPIDCGNGLCIPNRENACCPATPECAAARPNCDSTDFLCKECLTANQCPGSNRTCQAGACSCAPNQQFVNNACRLNQGQSCTVNGAVTCAAGSCEQSTAGGTRCCNRDCGQNELCNNQNQCQCQGCTINGTCVAQGSANPNNRCEVCDTARNANAFSPSTAADCRKADGADCASPTECAGGQCVLFYGDDDIDGFAPQSALATAGMFCTRQNGTLPRLTRQRPTSRGTTDCLDSNGDVKPTQNGFFVNGVVGLNPAFDYNCDGLETDGFNNRLSNCNDTGLACVDRGGWGNVLPPCGSQETGIGGISPCGLDALNNCVPFPGGPGNRACH